MRKAICIYFKKCRVYPCEDWWPEIIKVEKEERPVFYDNIDEYKKSISQLDKNERIEYDNYIRKR